MAPVTNFTDLGVKKLTPPLKGRRDLFMKCRKGRTLNLSVSHRGTKTWRVIYYVNGKPRSQKLGEFPDMNSQAAKDACNDFKPKEQELELASAAKAFKAVAEDWFTDHVDRSGLRSAPNIRRHLNTYVYPAWANTDIWKITRRDVDALLRDIERKHTASVADHVLVTIRQVMKHFAKLEVGYSPTAIPQLKRDQRSIAERARKRVLTDEEIRVLWECTSDGSYYSGLVRFLLLTGQRLAKVRDLKHSDVVDGLWTIRSEPREKGLPGQESRGKPGYLVLSGLALETIKSMQRIPDVDHVFVNGARTGGIVNLGGEKARLDKAVMKLMPTFTDWVQHDLRRTARTLMAKAKVDEFVAERVLGHSLQGVMGIYNRHDYLEQSGEALVKLELAIRDILAPPPANLLPFPAQASKSPVLSG